MEKAVTLVVIAMAVTCLSFPAQSSEMGKPSKQIVRALRNAAHINKRQTFGTCSQSQVASILSGYPSDCQSRLQRLDISALERGDLEELEDVYNFFCAPRCGQPLVNAFCRCGFERDAELVIQACSRNSQGQRCTIREEIEPLLEALTEAEELCLPYVPDSTCSLACKTALETARDLGGCCVNIFNITRTDIVEIDEYALWASCDVETPGFCGGSTLSPSGDCNELPTGFNPTSATTYSTPSDTVTTGFTPSSAVTTGSTPTSPVTNTSFTPTSSNAEETNGAVRLCPSNSVTKALLIVITAIAIAIAA